MSDFEDSNVPRLTLDQISHLNIDSLPWKKHWQADMPLNDRDTRMEHAVFRVGEVEVSLTKNKVGKLEAMYSHPQLGELDVHALDDYANGTHRSDEYESHVFSYDDHASLIADIQKVAYHAVNQTRNAGHGSAWGGYDELDTDELDQGELDDHHYQYHRDQDDLMDELDNPKDDFDYDAALDDALGGFVPRSLSVEQINHGELPWGEHGDDHYDRTPKDEMERAEFTLGIVQVTVVKNKQGEYEARYWDYELGEIHPDKLDDQYKGFYEEDLAPDYNLRVCKYGKDFSAVMKDIEAIARHPISRYASTGVDVETIHYQGPSIDLEQAYSADEQFLPEHSNSKRSWEQIIRPNHERLNEIQEEYPEGQQSSLGHKQLGIERSQPDWGGRVLDDKANAAKREK